MRRSDSEGIKLLDIAHWISLTAYPHFVRACAGAAHKCRGSACRPEPSSIHNVKGLISLIDRQPIKDYKFQPDLCMPPKTGGFFSFGTPHDLSHFTNL